MQLSERGYRKIKNYEGYAKALPDGGCTAYQERINGKLDIPTIGYGCTKGVQMGMVWTLAEAEAALKAEIAKHEARVMKLSTVDLNQNEFDALVSFDFNCGGLTDNKGKPTKVLRALNASDKATATRAMQLWNKFGGKPAKALIARRADEVSLFLEPTEPATPSTMPQAVEVAAAPVAPVTAAIGGGAATSTVAAALVSQIPTVPAVPPAVTNGLTNATAWQGVGDQLVSMKQTIIAAPLMFAGIAAVCTVLWFFPSIAAKLGGTQS